MEVTMAANFLAGTILVMMGLVVLVGGAVIINNLFSKYWKPVRVAVFHSLMTDKPIESEPTKAASTKQKVSAKAVAE